MIPEGSPWKLLLITRIHLPHSSGNTDLSQLLVLLSHFKKWTGKCTFHRGGMLAETWLLTTSMWVFIRKHLKEIFTQKTYLLDYFKLAPSTFHYFPCCQNSETVLYGKTQANRHTSQMYIYPTVTIKNRHLSQGTDLKKAALPLLLQLLLLVPSPEPPALTGIRGGRS